MDGFELQAETGPGFAELQPLGGVWWPREEPRRRPVEVMPGSVAMFDVDDPGELREWEPRGIAVQP